MTLVIDAAAPLSPAAELAARAVAEQILLELLVL